MEYRLQGDGDSLQDQWVAGGPKVNFLAVAQLKPAQQAELKATGQEVGSKTGLLLWPSLAKIPDTGVGRIVSPPFAEPGEGSVKRKVRGDRGEHRHCGQRMKDLALSIDDGLLEPAPSFAEKAGAGTGGIGLQIGE